MPVSPRWRRAVTINTILIGVLSFLSAIFTNIATSVLPESWKPHLWLAWPLAALVTAISIWLTIRQSAQEDGSAPIPLSLAQRNRQAMIKRVRRDWIDGVLRKSLYQEVLISLGLQETPGAIARPFDTLVQRPNLQPQPLPAGTKIISVFEQAGGSLLILGAPGAGKTTTLLELAQELLVRAEQDEKQPIPAIFNLSSWSTKRRPLDEWLVEELNTKYAVPQKLAQMWVTGNQVLPLLDGLDEVAIEHRTGCIEAINAFHHAYNLVEIAVCSRITDYEVLKTKLYLQSAVLVQPLSRKQADEYLKGLGRPVAGVRALLRDDPSLWELVNTPLWLNVITLAYQDVTPQQLRKLIAPEEKQKEIWTAYTQAMFSRKGRETRYTQQQSVRWLAWLAKQMVDRKQTVFLIERLQPDWLSTNRARLAYTILNVLSVGLIGGLIAGVSFGLIAGVSSGLIAGVSSGLIAGVSFGLSFGVSFGLSFGLSSALSGEDRDAKLDTKIASNQGTWQSTENEIVYGLIGALIGALVAGVSFGLFAGVSFGLFFGLFFGLSSGDSSPINHFILRFLLYIYGHIPWNYARFLDYSVNRIFLRRVGGGYIFVHRLLMEHFASLTVQDIDRITAEAP